MNKGEREIPIRLEKKEIVEALINLIDCGLVMVETDLQGNVKIGITLEGIRRQQEIERDKPEGDKTPA